METENPSKLASVDRIIPLKDLIWDDVKESGSFELALHLLGESLEIMTPEQIRTISEKWDEWKTNPDSLTCRCKGP